MVLLRKPNGNMGRVGFLCLVGKFSESRAECDIPPIPPPPFPGSWPGARPC